MARTPAFGESSFTHRSSGRTGPQRKTRKVLVVDDIPLNRHILSKMFSKLGFEVLEAENGQECIDIVEKERQFLSCVFLDLQMPVMNGWETAARLRTSERESCFSRMPIVACTATLQDEVCHGETAFRKAFASGVDDYVAKPLSMPSLRQVLAKHVPKYGISQSDPRHSTCFLEPAVAEPHGWLTAAS